MAGSIAKPITFIDLSPRTCLTIAVTSPLSQQAETEGSLQLQPGTAFTRHVPRLLSLCTDDELEGSQGLRY